MQSSIKKLWLTKELTKKLLRIDHYNLQTSVRFSKDFKVEQSFNSSESLFHKLVALNTNDCAES